MMYDQGYDDLMILGYIIQAKKEVNRRHLIVTTILQAAIVTKYKLLIS